MHEQFERRRRLQGKFLKEFLLFFASFVSESFIVYYDIEGLLDSILLTKLLRNEIYFH